MHLDRRIVTLALGRRPALAGSVLAGWLGGVVTVVQAWLLARVIAEVFLAGADRAAVSGELGWLVAAIALRAGLGWTADALAASAAAGVKHEIRCRAFDAIMARGPAAAELEHTGELITVLTDGVEAIDAYVSRYLPQLAMAAVIPLTIAAVVLGRDPLSGVVLVATAPVIPLFMWLIGRIADARAKRQWLAMARMSAFFLDTIQGLTTLKLLGRSRAQLEAVDRVSRAFRSSSMAVLRIAFLSSLVLELVATLSVAVVAVEIGLRLLGGRLAFVDAFFVLLLAPELYLPMRRLGTAFHAGLAGVNAASRLGELIDAPVPARPTGDGAAMPAHPALALDEVSYAYPGGGGRDRPALDAASLEIARGETVALVGPSGSGKSTVVGLLLRFVEPDRGRVTADGVEASAIDPAAWRRRIAWLPQRPHLLAGSVRDNLLIARPDATEEQLWEALRLARADGFVAALPHRLETPVGERGGRLSGGQARRVALARAFLADRPVVVLDEPAEDLDPGLRVDLDGSLAQLLTGRSALVIAHCLSTVTAADRIVVMDGGRVVGQGSHGELLGGCELYRTLVEAHRGAP
ncbi:MAG: thiol reductant ABC exporter subunit CydD [Thermoanaerobaculales bacterium]|jgi:thiol reductant ABC exporter CydD subunit|nr:thiol reductant ABC exporter subunit CydD [Thermoanaerobaculales bacterium]